MCDIQLKVNGQLSPLNINLDETISVTWQIIRQTRYVLEILDEKNQSVFKVEETSANREQLVALPKHSNRKKYRVQLKVYHDEHKIGQANLTFYTQNHDLGCANWITRLDNPIEKEMHYFDDKPNIILKKKVWLEEKAETAFIDICGLGYYTLTINGHRISNAYLNSDVTSYHQTIYYDTYRIEDYLVVGHNDFSVELGNGWYNPAPILILGKYNIRKQLAIGKPSLICDIQIKTAKGSEHVISDSDWESACGQFLQNNLYVGEVFTDNVPPTENVCERTVCVSGPIGKLVPSFIPKITRHEKISPVSVIKKEKGWVIDFGQIISGQIAFDLANQTMGSFELSYAETVDGAGNLAYGSTVSGRYGLKTEDKTPDSPLIQTDKVIKTKPESLHFSNQYTYHSFRYIFVTEQLGLNKFPLENLCAYRLFSDVKVIADFKSSSERLNQLWQAGIKTRQNNMHAYFEDCTRERFGYGGDIVALLSSHVVTSNIKEFAKKVFLDFVDAQVADGGITQTAPFVGIMTNGPTHQAGSLGWQMVLPALAETLSVAYCEVSFVKRYQGTLDKHLSYLLNFDFDYVRDCCLGDWGSIDGEEDGWVITSPDQSFCTGCMYVIMLNKYLDLINRGIVSSVYLGTLEDKLAIAKNTLLAEFDSETGNFASGKISSDIFAIQAELISGENRECQIKHLIQKIKANDDIFSFGIFGMSWAYRLFSENGENQMIYDWLTRENSPSYHDMLKNGNAALAEYFTVPSQRKSQPGSLNHAMFSSYSSWFMNSVVGLSFENGQLMVNPAIDLPIDWVSGSIKTAVGQITMNWKKTNQGIQIEVKIPKETLFTEKISQKYVKSHHHLTDDENYQTIIFEIPKEEREVKNV